MTLDADTRAGAAPRDAAPFDWRGHVPHAGAMQLIEAVTAFTPTRLVATARGPHPAHPLQDSDGRLPAAALVEIAAQAGAVHGALLAGPGAPPRPGLLAGLRDVRLAGRHVPPCQALAIEVEWQGGDASGVIYAFRVAADGSAAPLAEGRFIVHHPAAAPRAAAPGAGTP